MSSQTVSVCYTDLQGSTAAARVLGNEIANQMKREHIDYAIWLARQYGCSSPKDVGDGVMAWFSQNVSAAKFATEVLTHDVERPGIARRALGIKVGIERGEVEVEGNGDIKGDAANIASRVQGFAEAGMACLGPEFRKALEAHWGVERAGRLIRDWKTASPKGAAELALSQLDWRRLDEEEGLRGARAMEGIKRAGLLRDSVEAEALKGGGTVIWPVVPRTLVNAIHRAQLEIIRHLARFCDWRAVLLVADCGGFDVSRADAHQFGRAVSAEAERVGVKLESVAIMSDWFTGDGESASALRACFQKLSRSLNVGELDQFQRKLYAPSEQAAVQHTVMDFLRPILTGAAVLQYAEERPEVSFIVLAGQDERPQWSKIRDFATGTNWSGMVFNGILMTRDGYYYRQATEGPIWGDESYLVNEAKGTNLLRWLAQHFLVVPSYPEEAMIHGMPLKFEDWGEEVTDVPSGISPEGLVKAVWEKIRRR